VVGVADSSSLLVADDVRTNGLDDALLSDLCAAKSAGLPLSSLLSRGMRCLLSLGVQFHPYPFDVYLDWGWNFRALSGVRQAGGNGESHRRCYHAREDNRLVKFYAQLLTNHRRHTYGLTDSGCIMYVFIGQVIRFSQIVNIKI
jgi:hypothetical protein